MLSGLNRKTATCPAHLGRGMRWHDAQWLLSESFTGTVGRLVPAEHTEISTRRAHCERPCPEIARRIASHTKGVPLG
jgi:hypothetical protein